MPYLTQVHAQDAATGRSYEVLKGIESTAERVGRYNAVDVAVAYATQGGAGLLLDALHSSPAWSASTKRWLVSIDFGITQPNALELLSQIEHSEVRIPNGLEVLDSRRFLPRSTFHAKGYLFRRIGRSTPCGLVIGSANLSVSALATGSEIMASQLWTGQLSRDDRGAYRENVEPYVGWFEEAWEAADPLSAVLPTYRGRRLRGFVHRPPSEDRTLMATIAAVNPGVGEVYGELALQLAAAGAIWFETGHLYENRGPGKAGNQLDMPRGTRVFFDFDPTKIEKNSVLGHVWLQVPGFGAVKKSVRFANNLMDKINLPIPGSDGPLSYDNAILIFSRDQSTDGDSRFRLEVTDRATLSSRKRSAHATIDLTMQGGRPYGLIF